MNATDALMRLGASTAEAIAKVLDLLSSSTIERGDVTVVPRDDNPFAGFEGAALAVSVAYVDGVSGGNVLLMSPLGARRIAATMAGMEPPVANDDDSAGAAELTELELSAVSEMANQMMAAAASATGVVLGHDVEIAPPDTRLFASADEVREAFERTPHATAATFSVLGEPFQLVQLVPNAFVVRMTRALGEQGGEQVSGAIHSIPGAERSPEPGEGRALTDALRDIRVRVWAELGRARVSLGDAPTLPPGAVVELDRKADDPVDLYVNGLRFGSGRLVLTDDGEWALRVDEVAGRGAGDPAPVPAAEAEAAA